MRSKLIKLAHNSGLLQRLIKLAAKPCDCTCKACKDCSGHTAGDKMENSDEQVGIESPSV